MSDMNKRIAMRVAELLAAEVENAVAREDFGVIVRDVTPVDKGHFLEGV